MKILVDTSGNLQRPHVDAVIVHQLDRIERAAQAESVLHESPLAQRGVEQPLAGVAAAGAALAAGAGAAPAVSTSPLVMRPSRPEPATSPEVRFFSANSLAAAGEAAVLAPVADAA